MMSEQRWEEWKRQQSALLKLTRQQLPYGDGVLKERDLDEFDQAEAEFRAAEAEVMRITREAYGTP